MLEAPRSMGGRPFFCATTTKRTGSWLSNSSMIPQCDRLMSETLKQITTEFLASRHQLMSFIYGLVRDPQVAEDIFQEAWLKLAGALEKGVVIEHQGKWCRKAAK